MPSTMPSPYQSTLLILILCFMPKIFSLEFSYSSFLPENSSDFIFSKDSTIADGALQITPTSGDSFRSGRVLYKDTFKLRRRNATTLTLIDTVFIFNIRPLTQPGGEGFAFILTNYPDLPANSSGQWLGIVNGGEDKAPRNRIVALEFDTRKNYPADLDGNHIGLDVNTVGSLSQLSFDVGEMNISAGIDITVRIVFDPLSNEVNVDAFAFNETAQSIYSFHFYTYVDLPLFLLEDVWVGFSASTSNRSQLNQIKSWQFSAVDIENPETKLKNRWKLMCLLALMLALPAAVAYLYWYNKRRILGRDLDLRHEIEAVLEGCSKGPVRFRLKELKDATGNFHPSRELGKGGFGIVYRGYLEGLAMDVAVKRICSDSRGGEREFIAEVTTISQLSHRNLVKLIGCCHEDGELLLVYEFLKRGSLDKYLFRMGGSPRSTKTAIDVLNWERRYRIICGVASALDYLHNGSVNRVLHRDIKSSNVMLDDEYNARVGDFGLARVIKLDGKSHHSTAALAGTRGYLAPECYFTGRASVEADVFAFGVFVMEVCCGRTPGGHIPLSNDGDKDEVGGSKYIVDWLWDYHGRGKILHAADGNMRGEFDEEQMECAVKLALCCCHPNPQKRPSMRVALQVVTGGALPPEPVAEKPAFMWPPVMEFSSSDVGSSAALMSQAFDGAR